MFLSPFGARRTCIEFVDPLLTQSLITQRINQSPQRLPQSFFQFLAWPYIILDKGTPVSFSFLRDLPTLGCFSYFFSVFCKKKKKFSIKPASVLHTPLKVQVFNIHPLGQGVERHCYRWIFDGLEHQGF